MGKSTLRLDARRPIMALWGGLDITQEELLAIRWHMTAWDLPFQSVEAGKSLNMARDKHPLCSLVQLADGIAANLMEWNCEDL